MDTPDFFRSRIDSMIDLRSPLAVLATRIPWARIEAVLTPKFEHEDRAGQVAQGQDLLGATTALVGAGRSNAGRPKTPIRLMASLLYLKHSFNLSAYFSPSWTPFQADRGRCFNAIVDDGGGAQVIF